MSRVDSQEVTARARSDSTASNHRSSSSSSSARGRAPSGEVIELERISGDVEQHRRHGIACVKARQAGGVDLGDPLRLMEVEPAVDDPVGVGDLHQCRDSRPHELPRTVSHRRIAFDAGGVAIVLPEPSRVVTIR